jgi:hypothetical protein
LETILFEFPPPSFGLFLGFGLDDDANVIDQRELRHRSLLVWDAHLREQHFMLPVRWPLVPATGPRYLADAFRHTSRRT